MRWNNLMRGVARSISQKRRRVTRLQWEKRCFIVIYNFEGHLLTLPDVNRQACHLSKLNRMPSRTDSSTFQLGQVHRLWERIHATERTDIYIDTQSRGLRTEKPKIKTTILFEYIAHLFLPDDALCIFAKITQ